MHLFIHYDTGMIRYAVIATACEVAAANARMKAAGSPLRFVPARLAGHL